MVLGELQSEQLSAGKNHETGAAVWFGRFDECSGGCMDG
jgi:hypothetical protein